MDSELACRLREIALRDDLERTIPGRLASIRGIGVTDFERGRLRTCWRAGATGDEAAWHCGVAFFDRDSLRGLAAEVRELGALFAAVAGGADPPQDAREDGTGLRGDVLAAAAAVYKIRLTRQPKPERCREQEALMEITTLPGNKGIAIVGRTGSGKSTIFFRSKYVTRVIVADTGSGGHGIFQQPGTEVLDVMTDDPKESPVRFAIRKIKQWRSEGHIALLDSFTTMQEQQVAWHKQFQAKNHVMSLNEHNIVVGELRDLALVLATNPVFTVCNTSPGGTVRGPDGSQMQIPKGVLVGYPSLSGLADGKESILSRFTSVWIVTPGTTGSKNYGPVPRGFLLPAHDIRGEGIANFAPIKDPLGVLTATRRPAPEGDPAGQETVEIVDAFLPVSADQAPCTIDAMIERIAKKFPQCCAPRPVQGGGGVSGGGAGGAGGAAVAGAPPAVQAHAAARGAGPVPNRQTGRGGGG